MNNEATATATREIATTGRATINGGVVHLATITVTVQGDRVIGKPAISIQCGARRVRGGRGAQSAVVANILSPVECKRCAAHA